jgi:hypothetical protein
MTASKKITNPFPGLRPFESDEYRLFFGREGQADALISRLQRSRFLAVVGTSGSGKSSLVRAGLLPALRGGMMAGAGSGWRIAIMRPGSDPIGNLALALAKEEVLLEAGGGLPQAEVEAIIEASLRRGSLGLVEVARQARLAEPEKLLVVVDQFEELFRFRAARGSESTSDDAAAFVKLLIEASQQREFSIYVVPTMRSDFLGDCAQFQGLPEAINDGQYLIPRMTRDERRFAITGPVGVTRGKITEPLVNRLMNDVGDNPDQLPILQHALMRTWDYWAMHRGNGQPIGLEDHEAVGTMTDALSQHADEAYNELPDERSRLIAEVLFKALTERGADNREIRRPTRLKDICDIANASHAEVRAVIEVFRGGGRSFLMPPASVPLEPETVIDISHESLIRNWRRLQKWVDEEAQSARIYRRLAEATTLHRNGQEGWLQGPALQIAADWREQSHPNAAWAERYHPEFAAAMAYLDDSRDARDALIKAEEERALEEAARQRRELEQAQLYAAEQARVAQRLRRFTFTLILLAVVALAAAGGAVYGLTIARRNQQRAENSERQTRALAGDLESSQRKVEAARVEVAKERASAEASQTLAEEKEKKALAEEKKAADAKADAEKAAGMAKAAEGRAKSALAELSTAKTNDQLNRDALAYFQRGDTANAEIEFENLTRIYKEEAPLKLAWAKSHLGEVRRQLGKRDEAIKDLTEAHKIQKQEFGEAPRAKVDPQYEYQDTLKWLAQARSDKGEYELAEPLYRVALTFDRSEENLEKLARNRENLGEVEEAEKLYNEALELRRQKTNSPGLIAALTEVAEFYMQHDELGTAIRLYEEALRNQEAYLEPYDPNIADTFTGLAQVYEATPYKQRAKLFNQLAREIRRSGLTRRNPDSGGIEILAEIYAEVGKYDQAARLMVRSQEIETRQQGPEAPGTIHRLIRLGDFFRYLASSAPEADVKKFYTEGFLAYNSALQISKRKSYATSELEAVDGLADISLDQKNFRDAERFYKLAVEIRDQTHKATNTRLDVVKDAYKAELAVSLYGLGRAAVGLGKYTEAEAHFRRTQEVLDGIQGFTLKYVGSIMPSALFVRHKTRAGLAELYRKQGRVNEADQHYRPLAETLKALTGEASRHEGIAHSYLDIVESAGQFYAERGDVAAAESFYRLVFPAEARPSVQTVPIWPEAYSKSLLAIAPTSCLDSMIRILESYSTLLEKAGRARDASLLSHGIGRLVERKIAEDGRPPRQPSQQGGEPVR